MAITIECVCGHEFEAPEASVGLRARCPDCGRERTVPKPPSSSEFLTISDLSEPKVTSGKAIASLILGVLFVFACLTGVPAIILGCQAIGDIKRSGGLLGGRRMAIAGVIFGLIGCLFTLALFLPAVRSAREAARRAQCTNNLKQIGAAMHSYHDANGCLPSAAIIDKDGKPLLSWRVTILPYLEYGDPIYAQFHLDEPWDSPHNHALLERMPSIYACPSDRTLKPGMTGYQAAIGPDAAFTPEFKHLTLKDFPDGVSNTIVVVEAKPSVPWTKPDDIRVDMNLPQAGLGNPHGYHINGFNALFVDCSVRFIKNSIAPLVLRALLTRKRNDMVSPDQY
jgi:hypothetical protein